MKPFTSIIQNQKLTGRKTPAGFLILGRNPVELAKHAKYKLPAMHVSEVGYTNKANCLSQRLPRKGTVCPEEVLRVPKRYCVSRRGIQNGYVSII